MPPEPVSPELALVDPDLRARLRAELPDSFPLAVRRPPPPAPVAIPALPSEYRQRQPRGYPLWARVTAALWVLVLGILIGGAAVPHAQDRPRVVPVEEDATICERPSAQTPSGPSGVPGQP